MLERAAGSDKPGHGGGIYPARWPDSDGWPFVCAKDRQQRGRQNCSNEQTDAAPRRSVHILSTDRRDAPVGTRRLAKIEILDNAEMGPRGVSAP